MDPGVQDSSWPSLHLFHGGGVLPRQLLLPTASVNPAPPAITPAAHHHTCLAPGSVSSLSPPALRPSDMAQPFPEGVPITEPRGFPWRLVRPH